MNTQTNKNNIFSKKILVEKFTLKDFELECLREKFYIAINDVRAKDFVSTKFFDCFSDMVIKIAENHQIYCRDKIHNLYEFCEKKCISNIKNLKIIENPDVCYDYVCGLIENEIKYRDIFLIER